MAPLSVIDTLFSMESPSTLVRLTTCGDTVADCLSSMDSAAVSKVLLAPCKRWNCERHWVCGEIQVDEVLHCVATQPSRFAGLAAYNPYAISDSLRQLEQAIRIYDFRGAYVHTEDSDVKPSDPRMYPLYSRCEELHVPVMIQVSSIAESKCAVVADVQQVFVDFPDLQVVLAFSGQVDTDVLESTCRKFPGVMVAFEGTVGSGQETLLVKWMEKAGASRCMWGSNGLPWKSLLDRVDSLKLSDSAKRAFLVENASRTFLLAQLSRPEFIPEDRIAIAE